MNLAFCISKKDLGLFVCCLQSVISHGGYEHYDVYVLESFLDENMKKALCNDFGKSITFHFISDCENLFADCPEAGHYPKEIFLRATLPLLLPVEMERVLYLDINTVVINSLKELYEIDFEGNAYAGCTHILPFAADFDHATVKHGLKQHPVEPGVLLINLPIVRQSLRMDRINDYAKNFPRFLPKEHILTDLWGDRVKLLDAVIYNLSDHVLSVHNTKHRREQIDLPWVRKNTVIVNYCDKDKPWGSGYSGKLGVFYQELLPR